MTYTIIIVINIKKKRSAKLKHNIKLIAK